VKDKDEIVVVLSDRSKHTARLVGTAPKLDIALLQIDAPETDLHPLTFVHQMPSLNGAHQAVLKLDDEDPILICGSGIILLVRDDRSFDWYFYVDLRDPTVDDTSRILAVMDKSGTRTDQRIVDLLLNPHLKSCFSGDAMRVARCLREFVMEQTSDLDSIIS
jgi:hypothetical protein